MSNAEHPPSDSPGPTKNPAIVRPRRRRFAINALPADAMAKDRPLFHRIKNEMRDGLSGLVVSAVVHIILLVVMAVILVKGRALDADAVLEFGWITPAQQRAAARLRGPVKLQSFKFESEKTTRPKPVPQTKDSQTSVPSTAVTVQPVNVTQLLDGRNPRIRSVMLEAQGGNKETERAISAGLMWLRRQQHSGGNWKLHEGYPDAGYPTLRTDSGATALALLAFLGAGHTHAAGDHKEIVHKGLEWLKREQDDGGDFHDIDEYGRQTTYYAHSLAAIAFCEAFAMTGDESLREPAERGIRFLLDSQHPTQGGWKYAPQNETTIGDLSVTGWALMALHSARAGGVDVPESAFARADLFLESVQEQNGARYKYMPTDPPNRFGPAMTAVGLLCRQYLGWPRDHSPLQSGVKYLLRAEHRPEWSAGRRNVYSWYYTAQVLHNMGGGDWKRWYQAVHAEIIDHRVKLGSRKSPNDIHGSWHPNNPPGSDHEYAAKAGRLYLTVMCILTLETPYRHLSIYRRRTDADTPKKPPTDSINTP